MGEGVDHTPTPVAPPTASLGDTQSVPDISNVQVPNNFLSTIYEDIESKEEESEQVAVPVAPLQEEATHLESLLLEVKNLLETVSTQLTEMGEGGGVPAPGPAAPTTAGKIGTNQGQGYTRKKETRKKRKSSEDLEELLSQILDKKRG